MRKMTQDDFFKRYKYSTSRDLLGGGGFGKVYKALDTLEDKQVAIKISEQNTIDGYTFSLKSEFEALTKIPPHRNIAIYNSIHTFEMPTGVFDFVIMQYYPSGNLSQLIKKENLSEEQKENIAFGLIDGISILHEHGVVHRDLKPSNILIEKEIINDKTEYIPKIIDFGLSKRTDSGDKSQFTNSITAGTYVYSSPEQLQGKPLKYNTDWWSYGAIIYELFTGRKMFEVDKTTTGSSAMDISKILENILKKDHTDKLTQMPKKWQKVLQKCFEKDPNKRIQNAYEINEILGESPLVNIDDEKTVVSGEDADKTKVIIAKGKEPSSPEEPDNPPPSDDDKNEENNKSLFYTGVVTMLLFIGFVFLYSSNNVNEKPGSNYEVYEENGLFGYKKGDSIAITPRYVSAENFTDGRAKVSTLDSVFYIDEQGEFMELVSISEDFLNAQDQSAWDLAKTINNKTAYEDYIKQYSKGKFVGEAQKEIQRIKREEEDQIAREKEGQLIKVDIHNNPLEFYKDMVYVAGGTFRMGCTSEQGNDCNYDEKPAHQVTLSSYSIGKYLVTQKQWREVMGVSTTLSNPSHFKGCDDCPVESVSWNDIQDFLKKLNQKTGKNYRLPTEAEWEFAARGGNRSNGYKYSGSNIIGDVAWYTDNSGRRTHPVGQKQANELGIYDMTGNVWEWCSDWHGEYYYSNSPQNNPKGPSTGSSRVLRGGSWSYFARYARVSYHYHSSPSNRIFNYGFRLAHSE